MNVAELIAELELVVDKSKTVTTAPIIVNEPIQQDKKIFNSCDDINQVEELDGQVCIWREI